MKGYELLFDWKELTMNLGWCDVCLNVQDLQASREFYEKLGLEAVDGSEKSGYWLMVKGATRIGLYHAAFEGLMLNFRGGDVMANGQALQASGLALDSGPEIESDGSAGAMLKDPDGNLIYLNTHPDELDPDYQKKVGIL